MKIWAVKLRFLLIYENILKNSATACSEGTAKHENKESYNTDYIVPDSIDFFGDDWIEIETQIEKRNIYICKKIARTKIGLLLKISENFLSTIQHKGNNVLAIYISY